MIVFLFSRIVTIYYTGKFSGSISCLNIDFFYALK